MVPGFIQSNTAYFSLQNLEMVLFASFLLVHLAAAFPGEFRRCSGGYTHGSQVDRGRYWYECQVGDTEKCLGFCKA